MRLPTPIVIVLTFILILNSCSGGGAVIVDWNKKHISQGTKIEKLVILGPEFVYHRDENNSTFIIARERQKRRYIGLMQKAAKQNDLELEVIIPEDISNDDNTWFNSLTSLRRHLFSMNFYQDPYFDKEYLSGYTRAPSRYATRLPIIDPKYASLSKELGTPFIGSSICVVANKSTQKLEKGRTLLLNIVVNIETGKTIFREIRELTGFPTENRMAGVLYDSYHILTHPRSSKNP